MSVLAIIPARSGSKGIPGKNFLRLGEHPLWAHAVLCAWMCAQEVVISSDAPEPPECNGTDGDDNIWLKRPPELASDTAAMIDVVKHVLREIPGPPDQVIVLLQPTAVFRTPEHVRQAIALLRETQADSVVSVVELPKTHHPDFACIVHPREGLLAYEDCCACDAGEHGGLAEQPPRRQDALQLYRRDGTCYVFYRKTVEEYENIYGTHCRPLIIPPEESCELDSEADWLALERRWRER